MLLRKILLAFISTMLALSFVAVTFATTPETWIPYDNQAQLTAVPIAKDGYIVADSVNDLVISDQFRVVKKDAVAYAGSQMGSFSKVDSQVAVSSTSIYDAEKNINIGIDEVVQAVLPTNANITNGGRTAVFKDALTTDSFSADVSAMRSMVVIGDIGMVENKVVNIQSIQNKVVIAISGFAIVT